MKTKENTSVSGLLIILLILFTPYIWNAVKFVSCDFKSNYRCEVIHGIGIFMPPASYITVWFADDE